ncbi:CYTH and CHAD domain-containing protein [Cryobacterium frigoriphilum]|uniref:CYTH and CHAD domain-containing protein n=1 Tax=Cryobacterium frigoriphilum TaxID=1259150 RepID=A0A4R9AAE0_9MICO|nr:CYTH and CHAD domain-containing protein [Cryobacterium frigoriphilum]TFD54700.1 CYTH and CHAD domain-containing protein [Cryobacterium frigoriphilum]
MTSRGTRSATTMTEIERKYDVDRQLRLPDLLQIAGIAALEFPGTITLTAVYFDTDAMNLAQNRIILRRREGGGDAGWHIKLPAREGRTELQWPLEPDAHDLLDRDDSNGHEVGGGHAATDVPARVLDPIRTIVRDRPLTPLARITTIRTTVLLLNEAGDAVAELADDDVSASDMRGGVFRKWREWEVELFSAAPDTRKQRTLLLDSIEAALLTAGAQPSTSVAKIARALGADALAELTSPSKRPTKRAEPHAGSAASVVATLRMLGERLLEVDPRARADEPKSVHTMSITVGRLQSVLSVYRRLFDADLVEALRADLAVVGAALVAANDAEVRARRVAKRLEQLAPPLADETAEARLLTETREGYVAAHDALRRVLTSRQYFGLLDRLDVFLLHPAVTPETYETAAREVTKSLGRGIKHLRERTDVALAARTAAAAESPAGHGAQSAFASSDTVPAALHEVGQAALRLRHAAEAVAAGAGGGKKYRRLASAAKDLEKALGAHRDDLHFSQYLAETAARAHAAGEGTFVYGVLAGRAEGENDGAALDLGASVRHIGRLGRKL